MKKSPATITSRTTATLMVTMIALTREESLMPSTSRAVTTSTISIAGMLNVAFSPAIDDGRWRPMLSSSDWAYPDQPTATTAAPSASSRMRSQPMIHAGNTPIVAYENVYAEPATGTVDDSSA